MHITGKQLAMQYSKSTGQTVFASVRCFWPHNSTSIPYRKRRVNIE